MGFVRECITDTLAAGLGVDTLNTHDFGVIDNPEAVCVGITKLGIITTVPGSMLVMSNPSRLSPPPVIKAIIPG